MTVFLIRSGREVNEKGDGTLSLRDAYNGWKHLTECNPRL